MAASVLVVMAFAQSGNAIAEPRVGTHPFAVLFGLVPVILVALGVLVVVIVRRARSKKGGASVNSSAQSMREGASPGARK
jgi:NADH:ubiquinone oxidoreductase subunit 6 (subunit J)